MECMTCVPFSKEIWSGIVTTEKLRHCRQNGQMWLLDNFWNELKTMIMSEGQTKNTPLNFYPM
jgi:hypothetical protein